MASTMSYQNFIALDRWGQSLDPDLIMSYSGRNDIVFPWVPYNWFTPYKFETERGLSSLARLDLSPRWLKQLHELFRHVFKGMDYFFLIVRLLNIHSIVDKEMAKYNASSREGSKPDIEKLMIDDYVNALKAIKRDFLGIPILVVYQPTFAFTDTYYRVFRAAATKDLKGYMNGDWYFYDLHENIVQHSLLGKIFVPDDDCHASDAGHVIISDFLEPYLTGLVRELVARRATAHPGAAPAAAQ